MLSIDAVYNCLGDKCSNDLTFIEWKGSSFQVQKSVGTYIYTFCRNLYFVLMTTVFWVLVGLEIEQEGYEPPPKIREDWRIQAYYIF